MGKISRSMYHPIVVVMIIFVTIGAATISGISTVLAALAIAVAVVYSLYTTTGVRITES
jgi:Flp pilus assembly protein protease CpaA